MKHRARVKGDATDFATVEIETAGACLRCASGRGCGAGLFATGERSVELQCLTDFPVRDGQNVTVETIDPGAGWLWLVIGAYGLPTLGLLSATVLASLALAGSILSEWRQFAVALAAAGGLSGGVIAWRFLEPIVTKHLEMGLCLSSARIVAVSENYSDATTPAVLGDT